MQFTPWLTIRAASTASYRYTISEWLPETHIPAVCEWRFDVGLFEGERISREEEGFPREPIARHGALGATYSVIASTNINGHSFPIAFELKRYQPRGGTNLALIEHFVGRVDSITAEATHPKLPRLTMGTSVIDFRFSEDGYLKDHCSYGARAWLSTNDPVVVNAHLQAVKLKERSKAYGGGMTLVRRLVPVLLIASILVFALVRFFSKTAR